MKMIASLLLTVCMVMGLTQITQAGEQSNVRVIHASPDAPEVDVYVDGKPAFEGATFQAATDYASVTPGERKIQVFPSSAGGKGDAVLEKTLTIGSGKDYSVVALGKLSDLSLLVLEDETATSEKAGIRAVHASPDAPAVDIAVKDGDAIISDLSFGKSSDYKTVDPGTYDLEIRPAGSSQSVLDLPNIPVESGQNYTAIAVGFLEDEPSLNVVLVKDGN
ncbi:DUF4397 domain-containing protein [Alkalihalobacillus sp. CinArs1]|uniref:DUF4397 domain-containing protein n=1 Tax=Alkalihalobacillus sp. CinArs1 TaxID=2995314 RepID=UPI0022DD3F12|nr:DUF4397 domain-containing protein [Alkalihalobacillus sp. CinArs1]